jgi:hypothetical protein
MNFATSFGLLLLGLLLLPVVVSGCLPDGRNGVPWYEARRDPTGLAPDPRDHAGVSDSGLCRPRGVLAGAFAVHTWLTGASAVQT